MLRRTNVLDPLMTLTIRKVVEVSVGNILCVELGQSLGTRLLLGGRTITSLLLILLRERLGPVLWGRVARIRSGLSRNNLRLRGRFVLDRLADGVRRRNSWLRLLLNRLRIEL